MNDVDRSEEFAVEAMNVRLKSYSTLLTLQGRVQTASGKNLATGLLVRAPRGARNVDAWSDGTFSVTSVSINVPFAETAEEEATTVRVETTDGDKFTGSRFDPRTMTLYGINKNRQFTWKNINQVTTRRDDGLLLFLSIKDATKSSGLVTLQLEYPNTRNELGYQLQVPSKPGFNLTNGFERGEVRVSHALNIMSWNVPLALNPAVAVTIEKDRSEGYGVESQKRVMLMNDSAPNQYAGNKALKATKRAQGPSEYEFRFDYLPHLGSGQSRSDLGTGSAVLSWVYDHTVDDSAFITVLGLDDKDLDGPLGMPLRASPGPVTVVDDTGAVIGSKLNLRCDNACILPIKQHHMAAITRTVFSKKDQPQPTHSIRVLIPNPSGKPLQFELWERGGAKVEIKRHPGAKIGGTTYTPDTITGIIRIPLVIQSNSEPAVIEYDLYFHRR